MWITSTSENKMTAQAVIFQTNILRMPKRNGVPSSPVTIIMPGHHLPHLMYRCVLVSTVVMPAVFLPHLLLLYRRVLVSTIVMPDVFLPHLLLLYRCVLVSTVVMSAVFIPHLLIEIVFQTGFFFKLTYCFPK